MKASNIFYWDQSDLKLWYAFIPISQDIFINFRNYLQNRGREWKETPGFENQQEVTLWKGSETTKRIKGQGQIKELLRKIGRYLQSEKNESQRVENAA